MKRKRITLAVLFLAFFFLASHIGLMVPEFFPVPGYFLFIVSGAAVVPLWWRRHAKKAPRMEHQRLAFLRYIIFVIVTLALCSAILVFGDTGSFGSLIGVGGKTAGLVVVYLTLLYCSRSYSSDQLVTAFLIFAICEAGLMFFTRGEWNANAVASRVAMTGVIGFYLAPYKSLQWGSLFLGLGVAFRYQSRTVLVGVIFALGLMWIVKRVPRNKEMVFIAALTVSLFLFMFSAEIRDSAETIAVNSLGSNNPIAQFFLEDKNIRKIQYDFLDRADVWEASIRTIKENLILGVGLGNESKYVGGRSHNAYLSLAVEGGVFVVFAWVMFYIMVGHFLVFHTARYRDPATIALKDLATCLLLYMSLSAMVETSGIASISAPNNLICLFIAFWTMSTAYSIETSQQRQFTHHPMPPIHDGFPSHR